MKLTDLIAAGRLPVGTEVYHQARRHADRAVVGRVQAGGIEVNGTVYASPSGAARAVSGTTAENGWTWWRVRSTGKVLAELRPKE
jgi:Restriction Enzyme Adenine Methylase Associated